MNQETIHWPSTMSHTGPENNLYKSSKDSVQITKTPVLVPVLEINTTRLSHISNSRYVDQVIVLVFYHMFLQCEAAIVPNDEFYFTLVIIF